VPITRMLDRLRNGEDPMTLFTVDKLKEAGYIMKETNEHYISPNAPLMQAEGDCVRCCSIAIMGFPGAISKRYYEPFLARLEAAGATASSAPNSVWFKPKGVEKATPIAWLTRNADSFSFDIRNAIAFGDCPHTNDGTLTRLPFNPDEATPTYCPFVSVAHESNASKVPIHVKANHVGGLEHGTAAVIRGLVAAVKEKAGQGVDNIDVPSLLADVVRKCQQDTPTGTGGYAIDGREV